MADEKYLSYKHLSEAAKRLEARDAEDMKRTEITEKVRKAVLERDSIDGCPCCIYCGKPFPNGGAHLHHCKRRSQGGEGIEQNLVTLCWKCHSDLHNGDMDVYRYCIDYLRRKYE